jgi:acyl-coenzyme A synthetase/AMP-(fatty) acid ligase
MVQLRHPVETEELAQYIRDRLAGYKVPHTWEIVEELPRDQNGKVLKRLLRQAHLPGG